jgi:hypothetical protein
MKMDFRKIACFGVIAFFGSLSAQVAPTEDSKEITMSQCPRDGNATPDESRGNQMMMERRPREDRCEYDVYVTGQCNENDEPKSGPCGQEPPRRKTHCGERKTHCGEGCHRKGAAKRAQE